VGAVALLTVSCGWSGATGAVHGSAVRAGELLMLWASGEPLRAALRGDRGNLGADDVDRAEDEVAQAWVALQAARAEQARIASSSEGAELRAAEQELSIAGAQAVRTRLDLLRLSSPDPAQLAEANRAVERAHATLQDARPARSARNGSDNAASERSATTASAALALQAAIARRDQILAGPASEQIEAARHADAVAQDALEAATDRLAAAREQWNQPAIDAASSALLSAQDALSSAEVELRAARQRRALLGRAGSSGDDQLTSP
jgi:hypothetical protein